MGNFSWITIEGNQIVNIWCKVLPQRRFMVYMHAPGGLVWEEPQYGGYGIFGGKDYFELLAELNGGETRADGIELLYSKEKKANIFPILSEKETYSGNFSNPNKDDPDQGDAHDSDGEDSDTYRARLRKELAEKEGEIEGIKLDMKIEQMEKQLGRLRAKRVKREIR